MSLLATAFPKFMSTSIVDASTSVDVESVEGGGLDDKNSRKREPSTARTLSTAALVLLCEGTATSTSINFEREGLDNKNRRKRGPFARFLSTAALGLLFAGSAMGVGYGVTKAVQRYTISPASIGVKEQALAVGSAPTPEPTQEPIGILDVPFIEEDYLYQSMSPKATEPIYNAEAKSEQTRRSRSSKGKPRSAVNLEQTNPSESSKVEPPTGKSIPSTEPCDWAGG